MKKICALLFALSLCCLPAMSAYSAVGTDCLNVTPAQLRMDLNTTLTAAGSAEIAEPTTSGNISISVYNNTSIKMTAQEGKVQSVVADWLITDKANANSFGVIVGALTNLSVPTGTVFADISDALKLSDVETLGIRTYYAAPVLLTFEVTKANARFAITVPTIDEKDILLSVNNHYLTLDAAPVIDNNRTLVPLRGIFEALGAEVTWDNAARTAVVTRGETVIRVPIGSSTATINGKAQALEVPAQIKNERTLVPVRFIAEALGAQVGWDNTRRVVIISA